MRTSVKDVILTAIHFKGVERVRKEAKDLAESLFCSEVYVKNIIRQVENGKIEIRA